jgi:hypothetical protein
VDAGRSVSFFPNIISNGSPLHVEDTNVARKTPHPVSSALGGPSVKTDRATFCA